MAALGWALNLGFAGSGADAPIVEEAEPLSRGGIWPDKPVEPKDWRGKSAEERRKLLERMILGLNEAPEEIQEQAAEVVEEYAPRKKTQPVQVKRSEYKNLAKNLRAIEELARLYEEFVEQEDEVIAILLSH